MISTADIVRKVDFYGNIHFDVLMPEQCGFKMSLCLHDRCLCVYMLDVCVSTCRYDCLYVGVSNNNH